MLFVKPQQEATMKTMTRDIQDAIELPTAVFFYKHNRANTTF